MAFALAALVLVAIVALDAVTSSRRGSGLTPACQGGACAGELPDYPPANYLPLAVYCYRTPRPTSIPTSTATATATATSTPTSTATSTSTPTPTATSTTGPCSCLAYPIAVHRSVVEGKAEGDSLGNTYNGTEDGQFGWLRWPYDPDGGSTEVLAEALSNPACSCEFQNAMDPNDTQLSIDDWIWANAGVSNDIKVRTALDSLINEGHIRVVVWDAHDDSVGANGMYHASNFAILKLTGYDLARGYITAKFVGLDSTGCTE